MDNNGFLSLWCGDCLQILPILVAGSVDVIIVDMPYDNTGGRVHWDKMIALDPMWECVRHVLKPRGALIATAQQPFTSMLVNSNLPWFRQELIWDKVEVTGFLDSKRRHLRRHENVILFSAAGYPTYNPQLIPRENGKHGGEARLGKVTPMYAKYQLRQSNDRVRYPQSILAISKNRTGSNPVEHHPTGKPVKLMQYLIKTFSNPGDLVLDFCMGTGSTGVAAVQLGRQFWGIEKDAKFFNAARRSIQRAFKEGNKT